MEMNKMINIRPISDLRNKYPEREQLVLGGEEVYLTKNGYGSMVVSTENKKYRLRFLYSRRDIRSII